MEGTRVPGRCPACGGRLEVEKLRCTQCQTDVQGRYRLCPVCGLEPEARRLLDLFLRARGNLKEVQRAIQVSYPTVRQRIEEMFRKLEGESDPPDAMEILGRLHRGEISVEEAERLLRGDARSKNPMGEKP